MIRSTFLEPLEARIAPALVVINPIADMVAGTGKNSATVELSQLFDATVPVPGHTLLKLTLNLDFDPATPGIQRDSDPLAPGVQLPTITIELFDDEAPLSVQNFLRYATNPDTAADYLGTFLHRMADFGTGSGPGMDIVQGGGFNVETREHLENFPVVHNEYSETRPNVRGTIAMAKTGISPNTATSEWFININDNSTILGANNNGGFTVFGEVIQGMNIVDRIATLSKANLGGVYSDLPVQNYVSDPDSNPFTPPPTPKPGNLIRITNVEVIEPLPGNATGIEFTVDSDNDSLVTPIVNGTKLKLKYGAEAAGTANITVTAKQGTDTVTETFTVTVLPNLIAKVTANSLPRIIVPGDQGTATAVITNTGAGHFSGAVDVKFYLSKRTSGDQFGANLDEDDILVGQALDQNVSIGNGGTASVAANISIPAELVETIDAYVIIAQVQKDGGPAELFSDDNVGLGKKVHALTNQFGTATVNFGSGDIATREGVTLVYHEADGDTVTLNLTGGGSGQVKLVGDLALLFASETTLESVMSARATGTEGRVDLNGIEFSKTMGTVNFGKVDLNGAFTASKGVQILNLGDVSGDDSEWTLGRLPSTATVGTTLNLGRVHDVRMSSNGTIAALNAVEWLDNSGSPDRIITAGLSALNITGQSTVTPIRGDFEADILVEGNSTLGSLRVAGLLTDSLVTTAGNIGSVKIGGMISSSIFAGLKDDLRPDAKNDFSTPRRSIGSFVISKALETLTDRFAQSQVAAFSIGKVVVRGVDTDATPSPFGFVADSIASYRRVSGPTATELTSPQVFDATGDYSVVVL